MQKAPPWLPIALAVAIPAVGVVAFGVRADMKATRALEIAEQGARETEEIRERLAAYDALFPRFEKVLSANVETLNAVKVELARVRP